MTMLEIAKLLEKEGHAVKYYVRKDGGILITEIDGVQYKGAKGNAVAREMTGQVASDRRVQQLKKITRLRKHKHKKIPIPKELEKMRKDVEKAWRKANIKGQISQRNLEAIIKERGEEGAKKYLDEMLRHAKGQAYSVQIDNLIERIRQDMTMLDKKENFWMEQTIRVIEEHRETFPAQALFDIFDALYELEKGILAAHDFYLYVVNRLR